ncbi:MAG: Mth938-like domain-containing protein [Gammaproteobacteria bacterium]|nr:Mth938-like domain-containing protein [Gammaproteobacteria bacterium]
MINFTLETPSNAISVGSCDAQGIRIGGRYHSQSLLLDPQQVQPWPPTRFAQLDSDCLELLLQRPADVYLIGTGLRQRFIDVRLLAGFYRRGLGVEVMHSAAACRTFNILVAEGRRPVAGIVFEATSAA